MFTYLLTNSISFQWFICHFFFPVTRTVGCFDQISTYFLLIGDFPAFKEHTWKLIFFTHSCWPYLVLYRFLFILFMAVSVNKRLIKTQLYLTSLLHSQCLAFQKHSSNPSVKFFVSKCFKSLRFCLLAHSPFNHSQCPLCHSEGSWASSSPLLCSPLLPVGSVYLSPYLTENTHLWAVSSLYCSSEAGSSRSFVYFHSFWNQSYFVKAYKDRDHIDSMESWPWAGNVMVLKLLSISMHILYYLAFKNIYNVNY